MKRSKVYDTEALFLSQLSNYNGKVFFFKTYDKRDDFHFHISRSLMVLSLDVPRLFSLMVFIFLESFPLPEYLTCNRQAPKARLQFSLLRKALPKFTVHTDLIGRIMSAWRNACTSVFLIRNPNADFVYELKNNNWKVFHYSV